MASRFSDVKAKVIKVDSNYIYVQKVAEDDHCANCSSLCSKKDSIIKLRNSDGYNINDLVLIRTDDKEILTKAMILYGLPILSILITIAIFKYIFLLPDVVTAILSILSIPLAYIVLKKTYKGKESIKIERL